MDLREGDTMQPAAVSPTKAVMPSVNAVIGTNAKQMALDRFAPQKLVVLLWRSILGVEQVLVVTSHYRLLALKDTSLCT